MATIRRLCFGEESSFVVFLKNYFSLTIVPKLLMEENSSVMFSLPGKTVMLNTYNGKTDFAFCFYSEDEIPYDRRRQREQKQMIQKHRLAVTRSKFVEVEGPLQKQGPIIHVMASSFREYQHEREAGSLQVTSHDFH